MRAHEIAARLKGELMTALQPALATACPHRKSSIMRSRLIHMEICLMR